MLVLISLRFTKLGIIIVFAKMWCFTEKQMVNHQYTSFEASFVANYLSCVESSDDFEADESDQLSDFDDVSEGYTKNDTEADQEVIIVESSNIESTAELTNADSYRPQYYRIYQ